MTTTTKQPPANIEAEMAVLGSMLIDPTTIPDVMDCLDTDSFFRGAHRTLFAEIARAHESGEPVDHVTLCDRVTDGTDPDLTVDYIAEILDKTPTAANAVYYARIVADKAATRSVLRVAMELLGTQGNMPSEDILAAAEQKVGEIIKAQSRKQQPITMRDACLKYVDHLRANKTRIYGSGLEELDYAIGGVGIGEVIVIAARPSHAKTAFCLHWLHECARAGVPGLILSEEMAAIELGKRGLQRCATIDQESWSADMADHLAADVERCYSQSAPVYVAEKCFTIAKAEAAIRRHAEIGARIVALDYVQMLGASGSTKRHEQVAEVSRRLKLAAQRFEVGILCLSQLNRGIEERSSYNPKLRDIRDSGAIEQDADAVLFVCWPWKVWDEDGKKPGKQPDRSEYRIIIGKECRNRKTRRHRLAVQFDPDTMTFSSQRIESPF